MSIKTIHKVSEEIFEGTSLNINFDCLDIDDESLPISSIKVYVFVADREDVSEYINGRDGSNSANLTFTDNHVVFDLMPPDNIVVNDDVRYFETHSVLFEMFYNSDTDVAKVEFRVAVKRCPVS